MNVKPVKWILVLGCALLFVSGCAPRQPDLDGLEVTASGQADPFETSPRTQATSGEEESVPQPTEESLGSLRFGLADEKPLTDETGLRYLPYTGGEISLPYHFVAEGRTFSEGVGFLLFLNGIPQPYHTDTNEEVRYLHPLYGDEAGNISREFQFCFTPVTGQAGDMLELYVMNITDPECEPFDHSPFAYTMGSTASWERIRFEATPEAMRLPEVPQYPNFYTVEYRDVPYEDIAGWSEEELLYLTEYSFSINGVSDQRGRRTVYGVTAEEPLRLRFELWGSSRARFGLSFFVDNQPVPLDGGMAIPMEIREGQKTIVELTLSMPEFDGEAAVYAILAPLNVWEDLNYSWFLTYSGTIYLTAEAER